MTKKKRVMVKKKYEVVLTIDVDGRRVSPSMWDWNSLLHLGADEGVIVQRVTEEGR